MIFNVNHWSVVGADVPIMLALLEISAILAIYCLVKTKKFLSSLDNRTVSSLSWSFTEQCLIQSVSLVFQTAMCMRPSNLTSRCWPTRLRCCKFRLRWGSGMLWGGETETRVHPWFQMSKTRVYLSASTGSNPINSLHFSSFPSNIHPKNWLILISVPSNCTSCFDFVDQVLLLYIRHFIKMYMPLLHLTTLSAIHAGFTGGESTMTATGACCLSVVFTVNSIDVGNNGLLNYTWTAVSGLAENTQITIHTCTQ